MISVTFLRCCWEVLFLSSFWVLGTGWSVFSVLIHQSPTAAQWVVLTSLSLCWKEQWQRGPTAGRCWAHTLPLCPTAPLGSCLKEEEPAMHRSRGQIFWAVGSHTCKASTKPVAFANRWSGAQGIVNREWTEKGPKRGHGILEAPEFGKESGFNSTHSSTPFKGFVVFIFGIFF